MFKKQRSRVREEEIVTYIEFEAGCEIPGKTRESLLTELEVSYALNGMISQNYIESLIEKYKAAKKTEEAIPEDNAPSSKSTVSAVESRVHNREIVL